MADLLTVRRGRVEDAPALRALGEAVVPATYDRLDPAYAALMLQAWWAPTRLRASLTELPHWVAEDGQGQVVGVANLGVHEGVPTMWKLYVHPDHHGSGVGRALLDEVEAAAGGRLQLEVVDGNDRAMASYLRRGFVELRRVPEPAYPSVTLVWMRKDH